MDSSYGEDYKDSNYESNYGNDDYNMGSSYRDDYSMGSRYGSSNYGNDDYNMRSRYKDDYNMGSRYGSKKSKQEYDDGSTSYGSDYDDSSYDNSNYDDRSSYSSSNYGDSSSKYSQQGYNKNDNDYSDSSYGYNDGSMDYSYGNDGFLLSKELYTESEAKSFCKSKGLKLAEVNEENMKNANDKLKKNYAIDAYIFSWDNDSYIGSCLILTAGKKSTGAITPEINCNAKHYALCN